MKIELKIKRLPPILREKELEKRLSRAMKVAAETYTQLVHNWIEEGKAFTPRTGNLQRSITWYYKNNTARIVAQAEYAKFVEYGTKPHIIKPLRRKALKIPTEQGYVFARKVKHPGSKPYPFLLADLQNRARQVAVEFMKALEGVI